MEEIQKEQTECKSECSYNSRNEYRRFHIKDKKTRKEFEALF